jgi:hypothetical protein
LELAALRRMRRDLRLVFLSSFLFGLVACGGGVEPSRGTDGPPAPTANPPAPTPSAPTPSTPAPTPSTPAPTPIPVEPGTPPATQPVPIVVGQSIRVTQNVYGSDPCHGDSWGGELPERVDLDFTTRELVRSLPDCSADAGILWSGAFAEASHRTLTQDEVASVQSILGGLHEGPRPLPCVPDGIQIELEVTSSGQTTTYLDRDTNCYNKPGMKYVDASMVPLMQALDTLAAK